MTTTPDSNVGRKIILWRKEFRTDAYTDQMGVKQPAYVVLEEMPVTIVEVKPVKAMWGKETYSGWRAVSPTGEEFTCNWKVFPDDSLTPTYYWDFKHDQRGTWQPIDAFQATNFGLLYVTTTGEKAFPQGSQLCSKHKYYFPEDELCPLCN